MLMCHPSGYDWFPGERIVLRDFYVRWDEIEEEQGEAGCLGFAGGYVMRYSGVWDWPGAVIHTGTSTS